MKHSIPAIIVCISSYGCANGGDDADGKPAPNEQTIVSELVINGGACGRDVECQSGLCLSLSHICANKLINGGACGRDLECQSGLCLTTSHTCANKLINGGACGRDVECLSGVCSTISHTCI